MEATGTDRERRCELFLRAIRLIFDLRISKASKSSGAGTLSAVTGVDSSAMVESQIRAPHAISV